MTPVTALMQGLLGLPAPVINRIAGTPPSIDGNTLDPAVNLLLYLAERIGASRNHDLQRRREGMNRNTAMVMPRVAGVQTSDHLLASRIRARVYRAQGRAGEVPVIMYLHGGGWVVGDLDSHDGTCRMLARYSGCVVVSVDYALAPEKPFPAGLEDAVAAFDHLCAHPEQFGGEPGAVAVCGDSAGGNLAAALCLVRQPGPIAAALIYPVVDLRLQHQSVATFAEGYFLTREDMHWYRDQYLPDLALVTDPRVSPLLADDLSGFPPTAIWTAGFDPLRDEGAEFAEQLRADGVRVDYSCLTDQIHGFMGMGVLPGGMERIQDICEQIGRLVAQNRPPA